MINRKKWNMKLSLVAMMLLGILVIGGCSTNKQAEEKQQTATVTEKAPVMRVATLKGPTGMGMVDLMEKESSKAGDKAYTFTLLDSPDDLVGKIVNGEVEIAAVPTNMAAMLYYKTGGKVKLAAVNTLGVLYVLENGDTVHSMADLKGKSLASSGKGSSADFVFRDLVKKNHLSPDQDVTVEFKLQHAELAAAMASGDVKLGILPQPHATVAMMKNPKLRVALDLTKEWEKVEGAGVKLPMGCILVNADFAAKHPAVLNQFLDSYKASVAFTNEQPKAASQLIEKYGILPKAAIAMKAIVPSNIVYVDAQEAKPFVDQFMKVLFEFEPKSVGGKLPDEGFYYKR